MNRRDFLKWLGTISTAYMTGCATIRDYSLPGIKIDGKRDSLRVATYNIANARGNTPHFLHMPGTSKTRANLESIVSLARKEDIDVLCMQEVDFDSNRSRNVNQAEYLAKRLNYNHVIEDRFFDLPDLLSVGNAVVSRFPLKTNYIHHYGDNFFRRLKHLFKSFVDFNVDVNGTPINLFNLHFDAESEENRIEEMRYLANYLTSKDSPFVVMGDFNAGLDRPSFQEFIHSPAMKGCDIPDYLTYPSDVPHSSLDYILSSGYKLVDYHIKATEASDHRAVIAEVRL